MHSPNFLVSIQTSRSDSCARRDAPATQWKQGVAVTCTARRPVIVRDVRDSSTIGLRASERASPELLDRTHSESLATFWTCHVTVSRWRGKRPSRRRPCQARGDRQGCTECRRFPLRAYLPRPVQTGGGRSVTPSSTQLESLGRLLLFG